MGETLFSHQKAKSPEASYSDGGLRSFFVYRDTGVNAATNGKVRVQMVRAAPAFLFRPETTPLQRKDQRFESTPLQR
jgi:hypothetical protein